MASRTRSEVGRTWSPTGALQAPAPVLPTDHTHRSTLPARPSGPTAPRTGIRREPTAGPGCGGAAIPFWPA